MTKNTLYKNIRELVKQIGDGFMPAPKSVDAILEKIDYFISNQLNEIMHHPDFQKLEASWRGLRYLVEQSETGQSIKIKVLNVSKKDLLKDFQKATEYDHSFFFKKVHNDVYGVLGGEPFSAIIGDYEFNHHPQDLFLLNNLSHAAAAAHTPFISAASPELFQWKSFTEMYGHTDLAKIFHNVEYTKWNVLRDTEDSKYIVLVLPRILMRLPYGETTVPVRAFCYNEEENGMDLTKYLWGNGAYVLGVCLTNAFARYHWCATIKGKKGGDPLQSLPLHRFPKEDMSIAFKRSIEACIDARQEIQFARLGFIPLLQSPGVEYVRIFSTQTIQEPKVYDSNDANIISKISCQLQYVLATSRFAHYLKCIIRDRAAGSIDRQQAEEILNKWISGYVLPVDQASEEMKAAFPLREARVDVHELTDKPGNYRAVAFLRPRFQLEELTMSLRLVVSLP